MPGARSAELCWGQRYHWLRYHQVPEWARHDAHIVAACPVPEGVSLSDLRAALDYLVRRHESLRTVYRAGPGGAPRQLVQPPAALPLTLASTERDGTPAPAAVIAELTDRAFALEQEWPIRCCAVTTGGQPRRLVLVLNHLAFDDWSLDRFRHEFETLLQALVQRRRAPLPPVRYQPADLAAVESERPAAGAAALAYWREEAGWLSADPFVRRRSAADGPKAHSASLTSPVLPAAAREIAGRHRVWPSAAYLAAYAAGLAAYTGERTVAFGWLTSHRREATPQTSVLTCMFSPALVTVEVDGGLRFGELVRRVAERVELAQDHAYAPYDEILELLAEESERRGRPVRVGSEINYLSHAQRSCGTSRERFVRHPVPEAWAAAGTSTYFRIHEWADGTTLALNALAEVMDAEAVERLLRGCAALLEAGDPTVAEAAELFGFPTAPVRRVGRSGPHTVDPDAPDHPAGEAGEQALRVLLEAVTRVNGLTGPVDPAGGYRAAGGRVLRIPEVVRELTEAGWAGLAPDRLTGGAPLVAVAAGLSRQGAPA